MVQDIDHVKRTSKELESRLEELAALYDTAPIGLCMLDSDQRFVRVNKRLAEMNGVAVEDHIGRTVAEIVPGIRSDVEALFQQVMETRSPALNVEIVGETAARLGERRSWIESWVPILDERGAVAGINIVAEETTEKKRQDRELFEAHTRLKTLLSTVGAGTFVWQLPDGAVEDDGGLASLFGIEYPATTKRSPEEYLRRIHPDDVYHVRRKLSSIFEGESRYTDEYRVVQRDGQIRWCAARGGVDENRVFRGAVFDITDLKKTELSLREAQENADRHAAERDAILGQLSEGVVITDPAGAITFVNRAAARIHGVEQLDVTPEHYSAAYNLYTEEGLPYPPDELPLSRAVRGEVVTDERWRIRRPDGTEVLAIGNAKPVYTQDGALLGAVLTLRDDTQRHTAEQALAVSERRLNAVLNNTRMAVFVMDDRQHCVFMNAAAEALTGYTFEETQGRPLHDVIHHTYPDGRPFPLHECAIDRAFPENNQTEGEEMFVHKSGYFYPVAFTASPIRNEAAKSVGTIIEVRDIRKEKANEERVQLLIGELNHRVKNTLATVQSIAWQALRGKGVPEGVRESIESRLVALSRSHDLLTREAWSDAGLSDLVRGALDPFGITDGRAGRFRIEGENIRLRPKAALALGMAVHELATNAIKYGALSNDSGEVRLSWAIEHDQRLRITWKEVGGPPVKSPTRMGFGSRLIERGLAFELDGTVTLEYAKTGVTCVISIPVPKRVGNPG